MVENFADNERKVREAAARGEIADFTSADAAAPKPKIGAAFLRRLMLGLEQESEGRAIKLPPPGVHIKGAFVEGVLDLSDCAGPGLPALALEQCDLPHRIDLTSARLARLSLRGSRFRELRGEGVRIDGDFDFSRAAPATADIGGDDTAYIRLRTARIGGDVWGRGARLRAPDAITDAFNARGADIGGDVVLGESDDTRFEAEGTVMLFGAKIGGSLICDGGRFTNAGGSALVAINAEIGGYVWLGASGDMRFEAEGQVVFRGAKIGASFVSYGGRFANVGGSALTAMNAEISGDVVLSKSGDVRFEAEGAVSLASAKIGRDLNCSGGRFANADGSALVVANAEIGGDVVLGKSGDVRFEAEGVVSLASAKIGKDLSCSGGRFTNAGGGALVATNAEIGGYVSLGASGDTRFEAEGQVVFLGAKIGASLVSYGGRFANAGGDALTAMNTEVGGDVVLSASDDARLEAEGAVVFLGAKIGGSLVCHGGRFADARGSALMAKNAEIGGDVSLGARGDKRFEAEGVVSLSSAKSGRDLNCQGGRFANAGGSALEAINAEIGGDVFLSSSGDTRFEADGVVALQGVRIGRAFQFSGATLKHDGWALTLRSARIEGELSAEGNIIDGSVRLAGLRVGRLFDDPTTAWGDPRGKADVDLNEIDLDRVGAPAGVARPLWRARARWLRRNTGEFMGSKVSKFSSQPWRQVSAAFERAGLHTDARRIRREEQREINRRRPIWQQPFVFLFAEWMFGYGLSVSRAAATVLAVWLAGAAGVWVMQERGALVAQQAPDKPALACEHLQPPLYALDVMLPILDLKQESACIPGFLPGGEAESARLILPLAPEITLGPVRVPAIVANEVDIWNWLKALFSILGAAVAGFALLTWTGVFRPRAE